MTLSRRNLLTLAATGAAAAQPSAEAPPKDLLAQAREDNQRSAEALTRFQLPMSTEPAFSFRA